MAKRRPNPEQQTSDRSTVAGCAQILGPLATRYPAQLDAALTLLRAFAASKVELPAKRKVASKVQPPVISEAARQWITGDTVKQ
jgi:hypothetical protein